MAVVDYFLKIDGIEGESQDDKHKGEIEILSWEWSEHQAGTMAHGAGGGAGKVSMKDFTFTMRICKASPKLMVACAGGDHIGYRGLPLLGTIDEAPDLVQRERVDHLYVALPLDEHGKVVQVIQSASREGVDIKVVPDLLQFIALRARLEELDGVPIININDVPLQGINSALKRTVDLAISAVALLMLALPLGIIALLVRLSSNGAVFYRQERMSLDGRAFWVYKFRSMYQDAERETGPIFAREDDPRCTPVGRLLRRFDLDELPQIDAMSFDAVVDVGFFHALKDEQRRTEPAVQTHLETDFGRDVVIYLPEGDKLKATRDHDSPSQGPTETEQGLALWAYQHAEPAGLATNTLPSRSKVAV